LNETKEPPPAKTFTTSDQGKAEKVQQLPRSAAIAQGQGLAVPLESLVRIENPKSNLFKHALEVYAQTFTNDADTPVERVREYVRERRYFILALPDLEDENKIVACAILAEVMIPRGDCVVLEYLFVDPERSGKGVGTKFFEQLLEYLRINTSYRFMMLECIKRLVKWYERMGAVDTGISRQHCFKCLSKYYANGMLIDPANEQKFFSVMIVPLHKEYNSTVPIQDVINDMRFRLHKMKFEQEVVVNGEVIKIWYQELV
jgi:GNAT superfamily N-acetyltransferase